MRRHLYNRKTDCPGSRNDIELTEEIKQKILTNRVYKPIQKETTNINQTINYYNNINNQLANIDTISKVAKYIEYTGAETKDFEKVVEEKYAGVVKRLDANSFRTNYKLGKRDFVAIIDDVSRLHSLSSRIEDVNIFYNQETNRLNIYTGTWEEMLLETGVQRLVEIIQSYYLDSYECYLINKINDTANGPFTHQECREMLEEYYKFLWCFDANPYVKGRADKDIYNCNVGNGHDICERFYTLFKKACSMPKAERNKIEKTVTEIVKKNCANNIKTINDRIMALFKVEEGFKKEVLTLIL